MRGRIAVIAGLCAGVALAQSPVAAAPAAANTLPAGGEGAGLNGPSSTPQAAGYTCDPNTCKLPRCQCASTSPPGGIPPSQTPMFITWTSDDAVQTYTLNAINTFLAQRKNPNGCPVKSTYFVSLNYTNHSMVTDMYARGPSRRAPLTRAGRRHRDRGPHYGPSRSRPSGLTEQTHVGDAPNDEIVGNILALNAFSGIPISDIKGFRAPFLNYSANTLQHLFDAGFTYDSSATSATPVTDPNTDAYWPYTLDNGMANDCLTVENTCQGKLKLPGMWEIPMYAIFGNSTADIHLMDPWLDNPDPNVIFTAMQNTFTAHYNGNRQPFGLYSHPIHLASNYPGVKPLTAQIDSASVLCCDDSPRAVINRFLDWAQRFDNVWIAGLADDPVTNQQLLAWVQNPVPASQLGNLAALGCSRPVVDPALKICNGLMPNEAGLLQNCPFVDFPWTTCYGCPTQPPTPRTPVPPPAAPSAGAALRFRLPSNCSTAYFDPIGGKCTCSGSACAFADQSRPIGPNGQGILPSGGTGADTSAGLPQPTQYQAFGSASRVVPSLLALVAALLVFVR